MCVLPAAAALVLAAVVSSPASPSGDTVMDRMRAQWMGRGDSMSVFELVLVGRDGGRTTRTVAEYRKRCDDRQNSLLVVRGPADVAGLRVLTWLYEDRLPDMWLYDPPLGRPRQLNPLAQLEGFMGSDLTYEDLGGPPVYARGYELAGEEEIDQEPVYRVVSRPTVGADPFGRVVTWVSRLTFLPVRIDYHDRVGHLVKTGAFRDVRDVGRTPVAFEMTMENVRTRHRTELRVREIELDAHLDCALFARRRFSRAP